MYRDPGAWDALMRVLVDATAVYLNAQAAAGAQVAPALRQLGRHPRPRRLPAVRPAPHAAALRGPRPRASPSSTSAPTPAPSWNSSATPGGDVIGLDWRVDLATAWDRLGPGVAVQGNLDPVVLFAPLDEIERQARRVLDRGRRAGPATSSTSATASCPTPPSTTSAPLVDLVHSHSR